MMRKFIGILLLTVSLLGIAEVRQSEGFLNTFFTDNFDNYDPWIFPSIGGWELLSNGSGNDDQFVDILHCVSHNQSLRLEGSSCWSAFAYHAVANMPNRMTFEANVYLDPNADCGCGPALAELAYYNRREQTDPLTTDPRGTGFAGVSFNCDGFIYGGDDNDIDAGGKVRLMPYHPNTWYKVRIDLDLMTRVANYYIDGTLRAAGIKLSISGTPDGVVLVGGFSINNPVWYDDVCVMEMLSLYPLTPTFYGSATLDLKGHLNIPYIQYTTLLLETFSIWANMQMVTECAPPAVCFKLLDYGTN